MAQIVGGLLLFSLGGVSSMSFRRLLLALGGVSVGVSVVSLCLFTWSRSDLMVVFREVLGGPLVVFQWSIGFLSLVSESSPGGLY